MVQPPSRQLSAELRLLGVLCRPREATTPLKIPLEELIGQIASWTRFTELLKDHRLAPLVARHAEFMASPHLPIEVKTELQSFSAINARESFRYLSLLKQLLDLLGGESVDVLVLKGVPLSLMAYGDVSARDVGDIDLLIEDRHALKADAVLRHSGLIRKEPAANLTPRRAAFYLRYFKDFTYAAPAGGFEVDLHWRLLRDSQTARAILPEPRHAYSEAMKIGPLDLKVLPLERTLLFLSVHGALESWARWKSLADVAALWTRATPLQRMNTWKSAKDASVTGFLLAALLLTEVHFDMGCGDEVRLHLAQADMKQRRLSRYLFEDAQGRVQRDDLLTPAMRKSTFATKLHESRLSPSFRSHLEMAQRILFRPRVWESVNLPDRFFALYPLVSPFEWVSFWSKKSSTRGSAR